MHFRANIRAASLGRHPTQGRQIEARVAHLFDGSIERWKAEPANHFLPAVITRNGVAPAMPSQRVIDILVDACRTQRVLEAVPKRVEDAARFVIPSLRL